MFEDREEAGEALAGRLSGYAHRKNALVLGIPRGGVIVGGAIAAKLAVPLDVFISIKLRAPRNEQLAVGSMTELGNVYLDHDIMHALGITMERLGSEFHKERQEILWRKMLYRGARELPDVRERDLILADDGLATGCTMLAAAEALRPLKPRRMIAAVPVMPRSRHREVSKAFDETVVLKMPESLESVGAFYREFWPVPDTVVLDRLSARWDGSGIRRRAFLQERRVS